MQSPSVFNFFLPDHPVVPSGSTLAADPYKLLDWYNLVFFSGSMPDNMRPSENVELMRANVRLSATGRETHHA